MSTLEETRRRPFESVRQRAGTVAADYATFFVLIVMIAAFAAAIPGTFLQSSNVTDLFSQNAIPGILALAVLLPLAAGEFDLSVAANLGFCSVLSADLASHGWPVVAVIAVTLLAGTIIGVVNGILVVGVGINAFIATLGMSTVLAGGNVFVTKGNTIYQGISSGFTKIATTNVGGVQIVVAYFVIVVLVLWYVLERTPYGRYVRAAGLGRAAAQLSGVRTGRYLLGSFMVAGLFAGLAGLMQTAQFGSATESVGPSFLLPAYAAAYLGATTIKRGKFNVWGTVVGVALLAVGIDGLTLAGAATWVTDVFDGATLLVAVGIAVLVTRRRERSKLYVG